ncbi:hypothetical protein Asi02nite_74690 [Asanoa siamensis]|uniref:Uncharacterized protein n=1 Tax=Asanoa siamensis TaxID=926357 RepID=A0ABQ4D332_9ACTN|nr:hypothetical protein Asi02nite_74690 [Asanoa siamensis]
MDSMRVCPLGGRMSRRRQPTSVVVESGTTRSDDVIAPGRVVAAPHLQAVLEDEPAAVADDDLLPDAVDLVDEPFEGEADGPGRGGASGVRHRALTARPALRPLAVAKGGRPSGRHR